MKRPALMLILVLFALVAPAITLRLSAAQSSTPVLSKDALAALLPAHPLYGTLRQYDRQIAALSSTLHAAAFQNSGSRIDASIAALRRQSDSAAAATQNLAAAKADAFAARQDAAVNAVLAGANAPAPSESTVRAHVQQAYGEQKTALRRGAARDMTAYRAALESAEHRAYDAFVRSAADAAQRAYSARAQELRENESALLLQLARAHSGERMELRAKLQTLYLRPEVRKRYEARVHALEAAEQRAVAALRARDARTLSAYRAVLSTQTDKDLEKTSAELRARTAANLAARSRVLAAQRAEPAQLPAPAPLPAASPGAPADVRAEAAALRRNGGSGLKARAQRIAAAYGAAKSDLSARFGALRDANAQSDRSTREQIAQLQRDRAALRDLMERQIAGAAEKEARRCSCTGVQAAVRRDLQSLP